MNANACVPNVVEEPIGDVRSACEHLANAVVAGCVAIKEAWDNLDPGLKQWIVIGLSIAASVAIPGIGGILVSCVIDGTFVDMLKAIPTVAILRLGSSAGRNRGCPRFRWSDTANLATVRPSQLLPESVTLNNRSIYPLSRRVPEVIEMYKPRRYKEIPLWKDVTPKQWTDWRWQLRNRITDVDTLAQVINLTEEEKKEIAHSMKYLRMAITPYYATLMDPDDPSCPIRKQAIPTSNELHFTKDEMTDTVYETVDSPHEGLTHRYPDRVLLLITDQCSMYCRHCCRRRIVGQTDHARSWDEIKAGIDYVRKTPEVRDVLISGGDPLTVSDEMIEKVIREIRKIKHVQIVRIGSRVPCVLPYRITPQLVRMLRKYHPIWFNTHFNHPKEITPDSKRAVEMLADAGIPVGNQQVLLKGVNDCPTITKKLCQDLTAIRCRPYYIYQCDIAKGLEHFRTSLAKGIELIEAMRGHTSGFAVPQFVIDAPTGGGKIPVGPNYLISMSDKRWILRNYEGGIFQFPEVEGDRTSVCPPSCKMCKEFEHVEPKEGVAAVLSGKKMCLVPEGTLRESRRKAYKHAQNPSCKAHDF